MICPRASTARVNNKAARITSGCFFIVYINLMIYNYYNFFGFKCKNDPVQLVSRAIVLIGNP
jgi:hypothetical protein